MRLSRIHVPLVGLKSDCGLDGMEEGLLHNYSLCCRPSRPILLRNKIKYNTIPLLILPEGLFRIYLQYVYIIQLRLTIYMFLIYK